MSIVENEGTRERCRLGGRTITQLPGSEDLPAPCRDQMHVPCLPMARPQCSGLRITKLLVPGLQLTWKPCRSSFACATAMKANGGNANTQSLDAR